MIIKCCRCENKINTPNAFNADYIIAQDTIVREPREVLLALKENQATLAKKLKIKETETYLDEDGITEKQRRKYPDLKVEDNEYDAIEVPNIKASKALGQDLIKVVAVIQDKDIQKTGVICPDCRLPSDTVIWGVHKRQRI